jgi:hypothetical protein
MEKSKRKPSWKRKLKYLVTGEIVPGLPQSFYSPGHPAGLHAVFGGGAHSGTDKSIAGAYDVRKGGKLNPIEEHKRWDLMNKTFERQPSRLTRIKRVSKSILTGKALPLRYKTFTD